MCYVRLLVPKSHGPDKPLHLYRLTREAFTNERSLGDHTLPGLAFAFPSAHNFEHLVLRNPADLGQRHGILGRLLFPLFFDCGRKRLRIFLALAVEEVGGQCAVRNGRGVGLLDVPLVVRLERLLELNLLSMALGVKEFSLKAKGFLRDSRGTMGFTSLSLPPDKMLAMEQNVHRKARTCARSSLSAGHDA